MKKLVAGFFVILFIFCPVSCRKSHPDVLPDPTVKEEIERIIPGDVSELLDSGLYGDDLAEVLKTLTLQDLPQSTYDKIQEAAAKGSISRQAEVLLTLQAAFTPGSLPEEFRGVSYKGEKRTLRSELQWLIDNYESLETDIQTAVRPFIVLPDDPGCYFDPASNEGKSIFDRISLLKPVKAAEEEWGVIEVSVAGMQNSDITIFYRENVSEADDQTEIDLQAAEIAIALNDSWPKFRDLFDNMQLTKPLVICLTDRLPAGIDGDAVYLSDKSTYLIRVSESNNGCALKSTVAHELFHCFQFEIGLDWYGSSCELDWLLEATATWAENYVYPSCSSEQQYLPDFFSWLNGDRLSVAGAREYGSYMLFFFLTEYLGRRSYVPDILFAASSRRDSGDIRGLLMEKIDDIKENYGRFALCSWNRSPLRYYRDTPSFPETNPVGSAIKVIRYKPLDEAIILSDGWEDNFYYVQTDTVGRTEHKMEIAPGGMMYHLFFFQETAVDDIEKIRFEFEDEEDMNDVMWTKRQALIQIDGVWKEEAEDWTGLEYREFCRKKDSEYVTALLLIVSNAGLGAHDQAGYTYTVDTQEKCDSLTGYSLISMVSEQPDIISTIDYYSSEELVYCPDRGAYIIKSRNVNYSDYYRTEWIDPFIYQATGNEVIQSATITTTGTFSEEYDTEKEFIEKLVISEDKSSVDIYFLPVMKTVDWLVYKYINTFTGEDLTETRSDISNEFLIVNLTTFKAGERTYDTAYGSATDICEIKDDCIYGSRVVNTSEGANITYEFRYCLAASDDK